MGNKTHGSAEGSSWLFESDTPKISSRLPVSREEARIIRDEYEKLGREGVYETYPIFRERGRTLGSIQSNYSRIARGVVSVEDFKPLRELEPEKYSSEKRRRPAAGTPWTEEEDARLIALQREDPDTYAPYAHLFPGRTKDAIRNRGRKLKAEGRLAKEGAGSSPSVTTVSSSSSEPVRVLENPSVLIDEVKKRFTPQQRKFIAEELLEDLGGEPNHPAPTKRLEPAIVSALLPKPTEVTDLSAHKKPPKRSWLASLWKSLVTSLY